MRKDRGGSEEEEDEEEGRAKRSASGCPSTEETVAGSAEEEGRKWGDRKR